MEILAVALVRLGAACVSGVTLLLRMVLTLTSPSRVVAGTLCCAVAATAVAAGANAEEQKRSYRLPRGEAAAILAQFATESGRPILFLMDAVRGERTNAIAGSFTPREALERLLAGTALVAVHDPKSGGFVVNRRSAASRADFRNSTENTPLPSGPSAHGSPTSTMPSSSSLLRRAGALLALLVSETASSQTSSPSAAPDDPITLSPFMVSSTEDKGYRATNTLAGTRLNTSILETPAAISVLTRELLEDLGMQNTEDYLRFATSAGFDQANDANANGSQWYDAPARIRGFGGATVTRDFFPWAMTADVFNVERVEVNRGPNAVLFGVGAPGGVLNTSSKQAYLDSRKGEASLTLGSWNKMRNELDLSVPLVRQKLALRLNTVLEDRQGWRDFEFFRQKGVAAATTYQPIRGTAVRVGVESRNVDQVRPRGTPNDLGGTRWLAAGAPLGANPLQPATNPAPSLLRVRNIEQVMYAPQLRAQPFRMSTVGADMRPDLPGMQANGFWDTVPGANTLAQGQVDDPYLGRLIPWNAGLDGPGNTTSFNHTVTTLQLEQRFGPFSVELAYRHFQLWRDNRLVGAEGVLADPNPVRPGAYFANGDSRVAAGRLPGTLLPDIGTPNPYVGQMYVESQAQTRLFDYDQDQLRATLGYELDLTRRRVWLGRHVLSGLWQRDRTTNSSWVEREYNVAPNNNQLIDSTTNSIYRRTYLDFKSPDGLRGALDPWATPLDYPGVKSGFLMFGFAGRRLIETESEMVATQSKFLRDRLVVTAGWRRDTVNDWRAKEDPSLKVPNSTNLYTGRTELRMPVAVFSGNTRTFGVVALPWRWLGLSYNQSNSVNPQTEPDPYGVQYGTRKGEGRDFGLRLNLREGRLWLNANYYNTDDRNRVTSVFVQQRLAMYASVPAIINTLKVAGQPLPASMVAAGASNWDQGTGHTADMSGKGVEVELVGALTPQWSISLNYSRNELGLSNLAPFQNNFIREVTPAWKGNRTPLLETPANVATYVITRDNSPGRDFVLQPATINDAFEFSALQVGAINRAEGQEPMQHQQDSVNVFTSYRCGPTAPRGLQGLRAGIGANYRSAPIIGYDANQANSSIYGHSEFLMNMMLGRSFKVGAGRTFDLQLNVQNLLGEHDLLPFQADAPGHVLVARYPSVRRSWSLKASFRF